MQARNYGLREDIVERLPDQWPVTKECIANALYDAGVAPGEDLLRMASIFWRYRPDWLRAATR